MKHIAIYIRVSSRKQDTRSQEPDLQRWVEAFADDPVKWYRDEKTGKTMDRPGWKRLEADMIAGKVSKIVAADCVRRAWIVGPAVCRNAQNGLPSYHSGRFLWPQIAAKMGQMPFLRHPVGQNPVVCPEVNSP